eukprot:182576_1
MAISVTCECHHNNAQNCRCQTKLSTLGIIVIAILAPILAFFGLILLIFICNARTHQPTGFRQTTIVPAPTARTVGLSPATNYIPPPPRPPPPPMTMNTPQSTLRRTPHYVSRSQQQ